MLVFRIIATIFVTFSVITSILKNMFVFGDVNTSTIQYFGRFIFASLYSVLWRAFVITAIWLI
jgi:hypothetical protein